MHNANEARMKTKICMYMFYPVVRDGFFVNWNRHFTLSGLGVAEILLFVNLVSD